MRRAYLGVCFLGLFSVSLASAQTQQTFSGRAYKQGTKELVYSEHHTLAYQAGSIQRRTVVYKTPDGKVLATKVSQYGPDKKTPTFLFQAPSLGYQESVSSKQVGWVVRYQESDKRKAISKQVETPKLTAVIDAGFDEVVLENWDALMGGDSVPFSFLVPSRQSFIDFTIYKYKQKGDKVFFKMKIKNTVLSWLLSPIKLEYQSSSKRLLRFSGLGNVPNGDGANHKVDIFYQYAK